MIVDAHGHWGPWFFPMSTASDAVNSVLMDQHGIDVQIVSAVEAVTYDARAGNASLARVLARRADEGDHRLRGYVTIDPRDLKTGMQDLERHTGPEWVGVKIHGEYSGTPIASEAMRAAIWLATQRDLPVLVHTSGADVVDLAEVVAVVDGARVLAGHAGAAHWRLVEQAVALTERIWFEPSWSRPSAGRIRGLLDLVGRHRLLFGTDSTLISPSVTIGAIAAAGLDHDERAAVMGLNAVGLFRL